MNSVKDNQVSDGSAPAQRRVDAHQAYAVTWSHTPRVGISVDVFALQFKSAAENKLSIKLKKNPVCGCEHNVISEK